MKPYAWLIGGITLFVVGLILAVGPVTQYWRSTHVPHVSSSPFIVASTPDKPSPAVQSLVSGDPIRIQIPSLNIDLSVIDGYYNQKSKTWTLTKDKVQYATVTVPPNNQEGNTFLYGHNRSGVFNTLNKIHIGDEAMVTTANNHVFTYKFRSAYETTPTDASLFDYRGAPIMTVQTCSGVWYQNRQLFTFDLVGVR